MRAYRPRRSIKQIGRDLFERDSRGRRVRPQAVSGIEVDYPAVQARRAKVVETLTSGVGGLFKKNGVEVIAGEARLAPTARQSSNNGGEGQGGVRVLVGEEEIEAASVILATGSVKRSIPGVSLGGRVLGTEHIRALPELPARLAVVGCGGASGAEDRLRVSRAWAARCCCSIAPRPCAPPPRTPISHAWEVGRARPEAPGHQGLHEHPDRGRAGAASRR